MMRQEQSAGVIAYWYDAERGKRLYLMLQYPSGYWDFPKGRLESQETVLAAAVRELKEETNLEAVLDKKFEYTVSYDFRDRDGMSVHKRVTFFVGRAFSNAVELSSEHEQYAWLPLGEALKLLTYHNARQVLQLADQFLDEHSVQDIIPATRDHSMEYEQH